MTIGSFAVDEIRIESQTLSLRDTFRTHWKTLTTHETLLVRVSAGGTWGEGEAYTMDLPAARRALEALAVGGQTTGSIAATLEGVEDHAARSAVDLALLDLEGKLAGVPAHEILGFPAGRATSCVSVGVDTREAMLAAAEGWIRAGHTILKVKLTTGTDLTLFEEIRRLGGPALRLWVDANQAFDPRGAIEAGRALARWGIEVFEQPLPVGQLSAYAAIRPEIPMPIVLDEEIRCTKDVEAAARAGGVDGVNVKLAKLGGLRAAKRAIEAARAHGLSVFLGCYFESSLGIGAAAQLLAAAAWVDLDAPLFLAEDPYGGIPWEGSQVRTPTGPGLGVARR
jgi:L-alanine-DL-glutamate epimerase-like enolase superfamily enzyme